jgi:hypothetical protein
VKTNQIVPIGFTFCAFTQFLIGIIGKVWRRGPFLAGNCRMVTVTFPLFEPVLISVADVAIEETEDREGRFWRIVLRWLCDYLGVKPGECDLASRSFASTLSRF